MARLRIYDEQSKKLQTDDSDAESIQKTLKEHGITYEIWPPETELPLEASSEQVLEAFAQSIEKLKTQRGFQKEDVIAMHPNHPEKKALRAKFLNEHTHSDDEARYFVKGKGLFYIHTKDQVLSLLCEQGDLINIPSGTPHWFDMGENPSFQCIRVFTDEKGWVAEFTGSAIASDYPHLDSYST